MKHNKEYQINMKQVVNALKNITKDDNVIMNGIANTNNHDLNKLIIRTE